MTLELFAFDAFLDTRATALQTTIACMHALRWSLQSGFGFRGEMIADQRAAGLLCLWFFCFFRISRLISDKDETDIWPAVGAITMRAIHPLLKD